MEIADDEEHVQAFGGDFFGSDYCPEDFEGFDCNDDTSSSHSHSDLVDHEHNWEPEIPLPVPSPSQRRRGRRKWGLALSIECKILTAIHMSNSLTIPMTIGQEHLFQIRTPYHLMSSISLILVVLISMHHSSRSWTGKLHSGQKCEA